MCLGRGNKKKKKELDARVKKVFRCFRKIAAAHQFVSVRFFCMTQSSLHRVIFPFYIIKFLNNYYCQCSTSLFIYLSLSFTIFCHTGTLQYILNVCIAKLSMYIHSFYPYSRISVYSSLHWTCQWLFSVLLCKTVLVACFHLVFRVSYRHGFQNLGYPRY